MGNRDDLKGKRIVAFDFGIKRIGVAVTDDFHITVSTRDTLSNDDKLWSNIEKLFEFERPGAVLVGMPVREDGVESEVMLAIKKFESEIKLKFNLPVYEYDEAFSSVEAKKLMLEVGCKKSRRQKKGSTDRFAAALILRGFLQEIDG
ncbi:MAG: Holliday junction resolvase RuvX [Chloroflexota bacterium]